MTSRSRQAAYSTDKTLSRKTGAVQFTFLYIFTYFFALFYLQMRYAQL